MEKSFKRSNTWLQVLSEYQHREEKAHQTSYSLSFSGESSTGKARNERRETFLKIRDTLFDISKPDIKENLCAEDCDFIVDQQTNRKFTFGSVDKNVQRRLLQIRSREIAQQLREDKAAKEICLIKEIGTGPLEGISSSESDSAGSETSQGFISETAGASRQDFVKLYVPKRITTTSQVVSAADKQRISSNALNDVLDAIIRQSNGDINEFALGKASTLRGRKQARHSEFENIKETFKNSTIGEFVTIHGDEKLLKQSGDVQQTPHQRWALGTFKVPTITVQMLFRKSTDGTILGTF